VRFPLAWLRCTNEVKRGWCSVASGSEAEATPQGTYSGGSSTARLWGKAMRPVNAKTHADNRFAFLRRRGRRNRVRGHSVVASPVRLFPYIGDALSERANVAEEFDPQLADVRCLQLVVVLAYIDFPLGERADQCGFDDLLGDALALAR
jgi:hypothetical protein